MLVRDGRQTDYDSDTGLLSRDGLTIRVRELLDRSAQAVLACLVIRLHIDAGELSWIAHGAAAALSATTRLGDLVSRITATDFAVVARDTDGIGARRLAERISAAMREVFDRTGRRARVRIVVGYEMVSTLTPGALEPEALLQRASAAARGGVPDGEGRWIKRYDQAFDAGREGGAACAGEPAVV